MITKTGTFSLSLGLVSFKALIEESEMKKFPDNDLLRHLRLVTQDAEKCASVAQQLLNGKRQTRWVLHGLVRALPQPRLGRVGVFSLGFLGLCL